MSITKFDKKMFKIAKDVAATSDFKPFKVGCVVVYKKHILSVGANSRKTHPFQKTFNKKYRTFTKTEKPIYDSLHAEINALTKIAYPIAQKIDWKDVRLYVYRICNGKEKKFGMARPCAACLAAIKDFGIRHIYYTGEDSLVYERLE